MPNMRQAITWNNHGLVNLHLYTPLSLVNIYNKTIVPVFYMKVVGDNTSVDTMSNTSKYIHIILHLMLQGLVTYITYCKLSFSL